MPNGAVVALGPRGVSAELAASTENAVTVPVQPTTGVPPVTGLKAVSVTATQVVLTWTSGGGNTVGFKVSRDGTQIATTSFSQYTDTAMKAGVSQAYSVVAYDALGNLSTSNPILNVNVPATVAIQVSPQSPTIAAGGTQQFWRA